MAILEFFGDIYAIFGGLIKISKNKSIWMAIYVLFSFLGTNRVHGTNLCFPCLYIYDIPVLKVFDVTLLEIPTYLWEQGLFWRNNKYIEKFHDMDVLICW